MMIGKILATTALAAAIAVAPAAANDRYDYKNPANPTKNASKLKDSQYRGWHYEKRWEGYRKCVMARESGGNYKANGRYGSGAYQFIQSTWDSAMKQAEKPEWVGVRPHKAPPYVQDEAFWAKANPYPKKAALHGRNHWSAAHALTIGAVVKDC
jgi:hypothetical protein